MHANKYNINTTIMTLSKNREKNEYYFLSLLSTNITINLAGKIHNSKKMFTTLLFNIIWFCEKTFHNNLCHSLE